MNIDDEMIKKALAAHDVVRAHEDLIRKAQELAAPVPWALKAMQESGSLQRMIEDFTRNEERLRMALGPMEDLRRSGILDVLTAQAERTRQQFADFDARFRLPEIVEANRLLLEARTGGILSAMTRFQEQEAGIQRAVEAMRAPWLDIQNRAQSIAGFAGLQGIGLALRQYHAFDSTLADSLRLGLGDWRGAIAWPESIFTDPLARTEFYKGRGLDPWLTNFPAQAFEQGLSIAGLREAPPPLLGGYDSEVSQENDEEELGFERTNAAHDRLQRFESQLRRFIDERMTAVFGDGWIKHQVPGEVRKSWAEKKQIARQNGEPDRPLIAYADFTDYVSIITRRDNWTQVFEPVFQRSESVRESFQRLYPIRVCTMHARIITQDDELYLYVEVKRILGAMGVSV